MKIDLGGGTRTEPGWANLDPIHGVGKWRRSAAKTPWPSPAGTVEAIRASHVLEHLPAGEPRIRTMNEALRVLRPDGIFAVSVPMFPTWRAIADPTHVSFWVPESFGYFAETWTLDVPGLPRETRPGLAPDADYGIHRWPFAEVAVRGTDGTLWEIQATLYKTDPRT